MTVERVSFEDSALRRWWSESTASEESASSTYFQSLEWNETWWSVYGAPDPARELLLLAVRDGSGIRCIAPLFLQHRFAFKRRLYSSVQWIADELSPYPDLVAPRALAADCWKALFSYLSSRGIGDWLLLRDIHASHSIAEADVSGFTSERIPTAPALALQTSDFLERGEGLYHADVRRALARFRNDIVLPSEVSWTYGNAAKELQILETLNTARFGDRSFFREPRNHDFFHRLCAASEAWRCAVLRVGERPIHVIHGFEHRGRFHYFLAGLAEFNKRVALGLVNFDFLIRHLAHAELRELDFLKGEERYKFSLGAQPREHWTLRLVPSDRAVRYALYRVGKSVASGSRGSKR